MSFFLDPDHLADLHKSGLAPNTIERLKCSSVVPSSLNSLGAKYRDVTSAYKIPYWNLDGTMNGFERWKLFPHYYRPASHVVQPPSLLVGCLPYALP